MSVASFALDLSAIKRPLRIGIIAGEVSGDILAAGLMRQLKQLHPDCEFVGIAGLLGLRIEDIWPERYIFKPRQRQSHREELP